MKPISALIFPPGWGLNVNGPHIALPTLKTFLEKHGHPVRVLDLNINFAEYYNVHISQYDTIKATKCGSIKAYNIPYYNQEDKLNEISECYNGNFDLMKGFNPLGFVNSSSDSVKEFLKKDSLYKKYYHHVVLPKISSLSPSVIGINLTLTSQILPSFELVHVLRKSGFEGKIIIGGNIFTRIGVENIHDWVFELIDGIIIYQGEEPTLAYLQSVEKGSNFSNVPNLIWMNDGTIIQNKIEFLNKNLFVEPDFSDLNIDSYWGFNYFPILGSRGCYYGKCKFCDIPFAWGNNGFIGHGNVYNIISKMIELKETTGVNRFKFVDESLHPLVLKSFCNLVNERGLNVEFEGYARLDKYLYDDNFLKTASSAGLKKLYIGIELSPSEKRGLLNKSDTNDALLLLKKLNACGINVHLFTLLGFPGTGIDEALETLEFVLKNEVLIDTMDVSPFYYAKHTKVDLVQPLITPEEDWAVEYRYRGISDNILSSDEVCELTQYVENIIWNEKPHWLHPIYRMFSPWGFSELDKLQSETNMVKSLCYINSV